MSPSSIPGTTFAAATTDPLSLILPILFILSPMGCQVCGQDGQDAQDGE